MVAKNYKNGALSGTRKDATRSLFWRVIVPTLCAAVYNIYSVCCKDMVVLAS